MRRTKPYWIYKKTKKLRIVQILLGHKQLESTIRYLGIEVEVALEISGVVGYEIVGANLVNLYLKLGYVIEMNGSTSYQLIN